MQEAWRLEECGTEDTRGRGLLALVGKLRSLHSTQMLNMWGFLSFHPVEGVVEESTVTLDSGWGLCLALQELFSI